MVLGIGGHYTYRYLFVGACWFNDEAADDYQPNNHGGLLTLDPPHRAVTRTAASPNGAGYPRACSSRTDQGPGRAFAPPP